MILIILVIPSLFASRGLLLVPLQALAVSMKPQVFSIYLTHCLTLKDMKDPYSLDMPKFDCCCIGECLLLDAQIHIPGRKKTAGNKITGIKV